MFRKSFSYLLLLLLLISFFSCTSHSPANLEEVTMKLKNQTITVELARSSLERQTGLMNRKKMDMDHGMLFVFEEAAPRSFWMKNTLIPLSIAFMDGEGIILNIEYMEPLNLASIPSAGPAMYALEVNLGMFHEWAVRPGYRMVLPEEVSE